MWLSRGAKRRAVDNADHWQPTIHVNSSSFRVGRRALGLQKDGLPMLLLRSTYLAVEAGNLMLGTQSGFVCSFHRRGFGLSWVLTVRSAYSDEVGHRKDNIGR